MRCIPGGTPGGVPNWVGENGMLHNWAPVTGEKAPGKGAPCPQDPSTHQQQTEKGTTDNSDVKNAKDGGI